MPTIQAMLGQLAGLKTQTSCSIVGGGEGVGEDAGGIVEELLAATLARLA